MEKYPSLNEFDRGLDPKDALGIGSDITKKINGMHALMSFLNNASGDFIKQVWGGTFFENHFEGKLTGFCKRDGYMSVNALAKFIRDLDEENTNMLFTYILENYKSK